jgi:hypothetical protein
VQAIAPRFIRAVIFAEKSVCWKIDDQRPERIDHLEGMAQRSEKFANLI